MILAVPSVGSPCREPDTMPGAKLSARTARLSARITPSFLTGLSHLSHNPQCSCPEVDPLNCPTGAMVRLAGWDRRVGPSNRLEIKAGRPGFARCGVSITRRRPGPRT
jgi:hypothetical protein